MGCSSSAPESPVKPTSVGTRGNTSPVQKPQITLRIISVNDVYEIKNFAHYATCRKELSIGPTLTIGVLPGDFIAPSLLSSLDKGVGMADCMDASGIDYVCFGNHEDDLTSQNLERRIQGSKFVWLNSNMEGFRQFDERTPEYVIIEVGNDMQKRKVALLGLNCDDMSILKEGAFNGAKVLNVIDTTKKLIDKLMREDGVDLVIPLTHQRMNMDIALLKACPSLPLVVGGHDHDPYLQVVDHGTQTVTDYLSKAATPKSVSCGTVVKTGLDAENFAICDVVWRDAASTVPEVSVSLKKAEEYQEDPEVKARIANHTKVIEELDNTTLWFLPTGVEFSSKGAKLRPTTVGCFICSTLRAALNVDCAMVNGGAVRGSTNYIDKTNFTYADLKKEVTYSSEMVVVRLPGQVISDTVAWTRKFALQNPPVKKGYYMEIDSGMTFNKETMQVETIMGAPIDMTKMYSVAISQMHVAGFENIVPLVEFTKSDGFIPLPEDTGIGLKEIIVDYFSRQIWTDLLTKSSFEDMDQDGSGYIDKEELYAVAEKSFGHASRLMVDNLFAMADDSGDGKISKEEIQNLRNKTVEEIRANASVITI